MWTKFKIVAILSSPTFDDMTHYANAFLKLKIMITGAAAAPLKMIFAGLCLSPRSALPPVQICLIGSLNGDRRGEEELLGLPLLATA